MTDFINSTLAAMLAQAPDGGPAPQVTDVQLNHEKCFAFVEFSSRRDATLAMKLDGQSLRGQAIKVRRPNDYQPPPEGDMLGGGMGAPVDIPG